MEDESPLLLYPPLGLLRDPPWESSGAYTEAMYVPFQGPVVLMAALSASVLSWFRTQPIHLIHG